MASDNPPKGWHLSSGGNPQIIYRGTRITVFESDGGWKFCLADDTDADDDEPYFSDAYETQDAAMYEVFAYMDGEESLHRPLKDIRRAAREDRDREYYRLALENAESIASQLDSVLNLALDDKRANITRLTPILRKLTTQKRTMLRACDFYVGVFDNEHVAKSEKLRVRFSQFEKLVEMRISELRKARTTR